MADSKPKLVIAPGAFDTLNTPEEISLFMELVAEKGGPDGFAQFLVDSAQSGESRELDLELTDEEFTREYGISKDELARRLEGMEDS